LQPERRPDENRIVSVYRPRVDECQRLWFVDTGMLETPNNFVVYQRPSIWVIDLTTDLILSRFEIPKTLIDLGNGLASITIDVDPNSCEDAFAYIPDLQTYRLIVYDYKANRGGRRNVKS
jgi:dopachrome tautomerase